MHINKQAFAQSRLNETTVKIEISWYSNIIADCGRVVIIVLLFQEKKSPVICKLHMYKGNKTVFQNIREMQIKNNMYY